MNRLKRFPHFRQNNVSDCGPTCLRMIARYYGVDYTAEMLRRHCHVSRRGVNMLGISEGAEHIGLDTVGMKMTFSQLAEEGVFPCILYWNQSHFVVCYGIERDKAGSYKIHISDPASQRLTYTREEFERCWIGRRAEDKGCGVALMLEPGENHSFVYPLFRALSLHDRSVAVGHACRELDTDGVAFPFASDGRPRYQRAKFGYHHPDTFGSVGFLCGHPEHRLHPFVDYAAHEFAYRHCADFRFPDQTYGHALAVF